MIKAKQKSKKDINAPQRKIAVETDTFRELFENSPDGIILVDIESKKFYMVNEAICQMLDYNREEMLNLGVNDIHPQDDLPHVIEIFEKQSKGEIKAAASLPVKKKDGAVFYADIKVLLMTLAGKKYMAGIFRDITERKKAEEELNLRAELLDNAVDSITLADLDNNFVYVNDAFCKLLGHTKEEISKMKIPSIIPPGYEEIVGKIYQDISEKGESSRELANISKNGTIIPIELHSRLVESGGKKFVLSVIRDITERKQAEGKNQKLNEELQVILDSVPAWIFYKDKENRFVRVNKAYADATGMPKEKLEGASLFDLYSKEEAEKYWKDDKEVTESGKPKIGIIESVTTKEGTLWVRTDKLPYRDLQGNIIGVLGFAIDITEQKKAQDKVSESELRYELVARATNYAIWDWNLVNNEILWNDGLLKVLGYSSDNLNPNGDWWIEHIHPDDRKRVETGIHAIIDSGDKQNWEDEYRFHHKNGSYLYILDYGHVVHDVDGKPVRMVGAMQNITERKNMEIELQKHRSNLEQLIKEKTEELSKNEENLRLASKSANIGMWFWNVKTGDLIWTDICKKLFGLPADKKMSYEIFLEALHLDDRKPTDDEVKKTLDQHSEYNVQYRALYADGSVHWLNAVGMPYYDSEGNIERLVGVVIDIDKIKKTEENLKNSYAELDKKVNELERFRKATIEREFRIKELNDEIERLKAEKK